MRRSLGWLVTGGCALIGLQGCAPNYLPRVRADAFQRPAPPPLIYVVSPSLDVSHGYMTPLETLVGYVKKAHQALLQEIAAELQGKGYRTAGQLIDFEEFPKDRQEERLRGAVMDGYTEFRLMAGALSRNLPKEHEQPLDYSLGRRASELANLFDPKPDWLLFMDTSAYVIGILPISEGEKTAGRLLAAAMGIGLAPPGDDFMAYQAALVEAQTGRVIWVHGGGGLAQSLLFPSSRQRAVQQFFKSVPASSSALTGTTS